MSMAWWCQTCGGPVEPSVLIVRVETRATTKTSKAIYCSDRCADFDRTLTRTFEDVRKQQVAERRNA